MLPEMLYPRGHHWRLGQLPPGNPPDALLFEYLIRAVAQPLVLMRNVSISHYRRSSETTYEDVFPIQISGGEDRWGGPASLIVGYGGHDARTHPEVRRSW